MNINYKEASINDVDILAKIKHSLNFYEKNCDKELNVKVPDLSYFQAYFQENIFKINYRAYIVYDNEIPVGYIEGCVENQVRYTDYQNIGFIEGMFLDENYRGQGISDKLFDLLVDWFKLKNVTMLDLGVLVNNENGMNFWKRKGFDQFYIRMKKFI